MEQGIGQPLPASHACSRLHIHVHIHVHIHSHIHHSIRRNGARRDEVAHTLSPTKRQMQEFETSLVYMASFRLARAIQ